MQKNTDLTDFLGAVKLRTPNARPLEDLMVSLKDYFPPLCDDQLVTCSSGDIDNVISDLDRLLTAMKIHRNAVRPIHTLPDDVLSIIFRYCAGHSDTEQRSGHYNLKNLTIMSVCRRWYGLIIHDTCLWSFIELSAFEPYCVSRRRAKEQLARSGDHNLHILQSYHGDADIPTHIFGDHIEKIQTLELHISKQAALIQILEAYDPVRLVSLDTFSLRSLPRQEGYILSDAYLRLPKLQNLTLHNISFSLSSLPSTLTDLSVSRWENDVEALDFLNVLKRLTKLTTLKTVGFTALADPVHWKTYVNKVHLPNLQFLSLSQRYHELAFFFQSLDVPKTTRIQLSCTTMMFYAHFHSKNMFYDLSRRQRLPGVKPIRLLKVETALSGQIPQIHVFGFHDTKIPVLPRLPISHEEYDDSPLAFTTAYTRGKIRNRISKRYFRAIGKGVTVLHTQDVLARTWQLTIGWWKAVLPALPALEEVCISADWASSSAFCRAMLHMLHTPPRYDVPRIKSIQVRKDAETFYRADRMTEEERDQPRLTAFLICMLAARLKEHAYPLEHLKVNVECELWPGIEDAKQLSFLVGTTTYNADHHEFVFNPTEMLE